MLSSIILFITAALGFLCTAFIFGKNKNREHSLINKYLIIITSVTALRFFFLGLSQAFPESNGSKIATVLDKSFIMMMPCFFLYFQNVVRENKFELRNSLHFIVPFLMATFYNTPFFDTSANSDLARKVFFFTCIALCVTYSITGFVLLYKNVWRRKTDIKAIQQQNKLIKNWSIFLYVAFNVLVLIRVATSITSIKPGSFSNEYLWVTGLAWIAIFVKIILTPQILYGYNLLNKTIDAATEKVILSSVWHIRGTLLPIISEKDKKLEEKVNTFLLKYLHQIEELSFHSPAFRNPDLSLDDIAVALKIPISHVNFIFKYHCNESFTDYKKIVRIHDATKLLEGGYLNNQKIESLAAEVGFSTYNTFHLAFKNITGLTANEYAKRF